MVIRAVLCMCVTVVFLSGGTVHAKNADLAGSWYTDSPAFLKKELDTYMSQADVQDVDGEVYAVLVPHAGLKFSGPVAAYAYKLLQKAGPEVVIVVGFTHRLFAPGTIAVLDDDRIVTPLGDIEIDKELTGKLISSGPKFIGSKDIFDSENSIEMQFPFIKHALPGTKAVFVAMEDQGLKSCESLINALYDVIKGSEKKMIVIASSDMSHYLPYDVGDKIDAMTTEVIRQMDPAKFYGFNMLNEQQLMCGYGAAYTVMSLAKQLGANKFLVLERANSGDTSGVKEKVVGYLSGAFVRVAEDKVADPVAVVSIQDKAEGGDMLNAGERKELLKIARDSIGHYLKTGRRYEPVVDDADLGEEMGAFVTLHENGELRGCIGNMMARGPLYLTVRDMAVAAATEDPRFHAVKEGELAAIDIEISVLSPLRKVASADEVEVGKHGVLVRMGPRSGVYLPQVATETGWGKEEFMNSLCGQKAGIPYDAWKTGKCEIYVFTAEVFGEKQE
ncbi:MAG: AmmeMemoRadiSam system protein B [Candidatus Omnitrophica bacterium]|nr:AmmeMemoRadiSam system protein B [Candidatus Omnitrophota bacterium]MDD5487950.1 AmmeMemoRadiSam system protein B [Candidatus Omnitrophota bacterium]